MPEDEGRRFGRYRVVATLGRGGMGEVFAAVDDVLGREVAIKTLRGAPGELGARILDERFRHEARAIAQLAHPGVVQVFDLDVAASPPYLVMERVAGPTLSARLDGGPLAVDELRSLGVQIARALAAAHTQGIIHRDVKPSNILAAGDGRWKLADFGVAHVPDSSLTLTGQFVGSPAYAAPEALTKGELGAKADVYGLGACLYQAASGRWPRSEPTTPGIAALLAPPPPLRGLAPHVPAGLAAAIERALAPDPDRRPTADELARALATETEDRAPAGAAVVSLSGPAAAGVSAPFWRTPAAMWVALGIALVLGIAIGLSQRGSDDRDRDDDRALPAAATSIGLPSSGTITATPPVGLGGKSAKDWNKIVDKLYEGNYAEARKKLSEFERKYGRKPETEDLADQLDALGYDQPRGKGRWKHDDD